MVRPSFHLIHNANTTVKNCLKVIISYPWLDYNIATTDSTPSGILWCDNVLKYLFAIILNLIFIVRFVRCVIANDILIYFQVQCTPTPIFGIKLRSQWLNIIEWYLHISLTFDIVQRFPAQTNDCLHVEFCPQTVAWSTFYLQHFFSAKIVRLKNWKTMLCYLIGKYF